MEKKSKKRKFWLIAASILMIVVGLLRGSGGVALLIKGSALNPDVPIIATDSEQHIVAIGLLFVCVFFIITAVFLLIKYTKKSLVFSWIALLLFFLGGLLNGYLLFGQPLAQGQIINMIAVLIIGSFLILGKPAINKTK